MELTAEETQLQDGSGGSVTLEVIDNVAIIHVNRGENRLNWAIVKGINEALDQVESNPDIRAVITTGDGRFYSNGLDLKWFRFLQKNAPQKLVEFLNVRLQRFMTRILTFPVPTIAALNGHCYAGGVLTALCHDYVIMNNQKGWFCLNEVHIKLTFSDYTRLLLRAKLPGGMPLHSAAVLGVRYTGEEAKDAGLIHQTCSLKDLIPTAMERANQLTKARPYNRSTLQKMKCGMYEDVLEEGEKAQHGKTVNIAANL